MFTRCLGPKQRKETDDNNMRFFLIEESASVASIKKMIIKKEMETRKFWKTMQTAGDRLDSLHFHLLTSCWLLCINASGKG